MMKDSLLRLSHEERSNLDILFVARHAPEPDAPRPEIDDTFGVAPRYNYELFHTIRSLGLRCAPCADLDKLVTEVARHNYVFTVLNRAKFRNSEVFVSTICEWRGVPYLGAPPNIRALAEDKSLMKRVAQALGIRTPAWRAYAPGCGAIEPPDCPGPWLIKPRFGAASQGIEIDAIQSTAEGLRAKVESLFAEGEEVIAEACISGPDLTIPVLGGPKPLILGVAEEISELPSGIATHRQKRLLESGRRRDVFRDPVIEDRLQDEVLRICGEIGAFDYMRVDYKLDTQTQTPYLLEINMGCNLGSHAAIMFMARHAGLDQPAVIEHIIAQSLRRQRHA